MAEHTVKQGSRITLIGVVIIIFGVIAMAMPAFVGASVALLIGILVLLAGLSRLVWAFRARGGERVFLLLVGVLTTLAGILMIANPLFTGGVIAILLAVYFIADGVLEIMGGLRLRPGRGWGWLLFAGIVSVVLGILIWRQFPLSGLVAVGVLLGIKLLMVGFLMTTVGSAVKTLGRSMSENG